MKKVFLAIDLGATSGRGIIGFLQNKKLETIEINRFPNDFVQDEDHLFWNIYMLYAEILKSIELTIKQGYEIQSIGIDTWGVDFVWLDKKGDFCGLPYAYRDNLTIGMMHQFSKEVIEEEKLYGHTGIQLMEINSIYQIYAQAKTNKVSFENVQSILFIPDALAYILTGKVSVEYTIASTSALLDPYKRNWDMKLIQKMGIPQNIFPPIMQPGEFKGNLSRQVAAFINVKPFPVVSVASHDTASAVAAIPAFGNEWAFLSLGTWSLMGIEVIEPIIDQQTFEDSFTNEGGVNGTIRFLKNITGFWLLEQCIDCWEKEGESISYDQLVKEASQVPPFLRYIDVDEPLFSAGGDMLRKMAGYFIQTKQTVPITKGEWARCIFESLAMKYRLTLEKLVHHAPFPIQKIHAIGGGTKNTLLCQLAANATGLPIIAGPAEATATGNILLQAYALQELGSYEEIREISRNTHQTKTYIPEDGLVWNEAYEQYKHICSTK